MAGYISIWTAFSLQTDLLDITLINKLVHSNFGKNRVTLIKALITLDPLNLDLRTLVQRLFISTGIC